MPISRIPKYKEKVLRFYRANKRMPTITELMKVCGLSSRSSGFYVANQLVAQGVIGKDRAGKLIPSSRMHEIRMVGHIRAGFAAPAEDELADTITVGEYLIRNADASYLLEVEGDSMEDAGIHEGDMVVFERGHDYKPGDIVVALTENGYTLKYLRKKGSAYYLEAANDSYPDIHPKEGEIIGVVTSTFRKYK
jgi:SOS-response transcriptional repressor LexA